MSGNHVRAEVANRRWRRLVVAGAAVLALVVGACGSDGGRDGGSAAGGSTSTSTSTTEAPAAPIVVDWAARTVEPGEVDGWRIAFCEGDGPFVCFSKGDRIIGGIELFDFPASTHDVVGKARMGGASDVDAIEALAADSLATSKDDRTKGCGPDYRLRANESVKLTVAGRDGLRYGWTAEVGGAVAERAMSYGTIQDDTLYLIAVGALGEKGCLERMNEFPPEELEQVLPVLDRVAAGSRLPAPSTAPRG